MKIQKFCEIVEPPEEVSEGGAGKNWSEIEMKMELTFPDEYKTFIDIFGTGKLADFIWVLNPFSNNKNLNILHQTSKRIEAIDTAKDRFNQECPYPTYPNPCGILPWGITDNGDTIFWLTSEYPNEWTTIVHDSRNNEYEEFCVGMLDFLASLLGNENGCQIISDEMLCKHKPFFRAYPPL